MTFILLLIITILIYMMYEYNDLVKYLNIIRKQWLQIDVYLKKRNELLLYLLEVIKRYSIIDNNTLEKAFQVRNKVLESCSIKDSLEAHQELKRIACELLKLKERQRELSEDASFFDLESKFNDIDEKISYLKGFYNSSVMKYRKKFSALPSSLIAKMFNFEDVLLFEDG